MTPTALSAVNKIYSCSRSCKVKYHPIKHYEFGKFCLLLKSFERQLSEAIKDDYWKAFLRPLQQYRFKLCATPLPFNHPTVCEPKAFNFLENRLAQCESIYPDFTTTAHTLFNSIVILSHSYENFLLDYIVKIYRIDREKVGLILKESSLISVVKKILAANPRLREIEIVVPSQLRGSTCYKRLIVIGPDRWFPDYVFSAPRATEINLLHYDWIRNKWQPEPVFLGSNNVQALAQKPFQSMIILEKVNSKTDNSRVGDYLEPEELLPPTIDWSQIAKDFARSSLASLD